MPFPVIVKGCPECRENLLHFGIKKHPERANYTIHRYVCPNHGPQVDITVPADDDWPRQWLNKASPLPEYILC